MKYYFFRDKDNEKNLLNGKTFHAAGYVDKLFCELNNPPKSGKDLAVCFFEPFEGIITNEWRAINEVELYEVKKSEYETLVERYKTIMNNYLDS